MSGLVFGWRTAILGVAVAQALLIAGGLLCVRPNRVANRTLATLLVVLAGILAPWMIGFAGFYDRWPQLTFAPFAITLAVAPLVWLYVHSLTSGRWPPRAWRHLSPAAAQFAFLTVSFLLPMSVKARWAAMAYDTFLAVTSVATATGLAVYGLQGLSLLSRYRAKLREQRSDDARFAATWLSRALSAMLLLLPVWAIYALWNAVSPLGYARLMGLHLAIAAFTLYLGVEGWRHAAMPFPGLAADRPPAPSEKVQRDWVVQGKVWAAATRAAGWSREPDLSLGGLAQRLGSNASYLSRALNEGLGLSFSAFINGLRSEAVAVALDAGDRRDLLEIAFDAGFASKASFNRAFRARYGMSPSGYRRRASHHENPPPLTDHEAHRENGCAIRTA